MFSIPGFGCESFAGISCTGFTDGDCLWDLSLGRHTGDGKFDGEVFLGRLWMLFLVGFYVLYYILSSGGFTSGVVCFIAT